MVVGATVVVVAFAVVGEAVVVVGAVPGDGVVIAGASSDQQQRVSEVTVSIIISFQMTSLQLLCDYLRI